MLGPLAHVMSTFDPWVRGLFRPRGAYAWTPGVATTQNRLSTAQPTALR